MKKLLSILLVLGLVIASLLTAAEAVLRKES